MHKIGKIIHERFLAVSVFLLVLSTGVAVAIETEARKIIAISLEMFGILIGIASLILVISLVKSFKGSLKRSFDYIIYGIVLQLLTLEYFLVFVRLKLLPLPGGVDLHHLFLVLGIISFTIATFKLRNMLNELK